jgi:hypothetical protein
MLFAAVSEHTPATATTGRALAVELEKKESGGATARGVG